MRIFLPWSLPMLPSVASHLLKEWTKASPEALEADLSGMVLVVRGRNAGRRLLALLAMQAQDMGSALIPPKIITPGALDAVLFESDGAVAGPISQRLAWDYVVKQSPPERLEAIWRTPDGMDCSLMLGRFLNQTWRELSASGTDFGGAFQIIEKFMPEMADIEEPRWNALGLMLDDYYRCLHGWGLRDPAEIRALRGGNKGMKAGARVALIGIIELAPAMAQMLSALEEEPMVFIHAPESEAKGFDDWGRLVPEYWETRPCRFANQEIHMVADANQQAERCAKLVTAWQEAGVPTSAIMVAVGENEAMPGIYQKLQDKGIPTRAAEGRSLAHSAPIQLLASIAEVFDSNPGAPPRYTAVASLIRHPDIACLLKHPAKNLDEYYTKHLPLLLDVSEKKEERLSGEIFDLLKRMREIICIQNEHFTADVTALLLKVYGQRRLHRHLAEDRPLLHALEAIRDSLDEVQVLPKDALCAFAPSELLRVLAEMSGAGTTPEPEQPLAVELAGWLEAAVEDAPALIVTSVFEGSMPEGASSEPLLHDMLRQRLGLPCRSSRYARDQYTLWTITESRRESGHLALIAPRRNAAGEQTRPSRLLVSGYQGPELAERLLALSSTPSSIQKRQPGGRGFEPPEIDPDKMRAMRLFNVTSFKTYLESPRLYYFKHILRLTGTNDSACEMEPSLFGTIIHAVVREYGARYIYKRARISADAIKAELQEILAAYMGGKFGRNAIPQVEAQTFALWDRLGMFAQCQSSYFEEGWQIAWVESDASLAVPLEMEDVPTDVQLKGKIDRIDRHPDGRWRVIDYKTSAKAEPPLATHYSKKHGWKDLQLPLYVKLLRAVPLECGPVDPERTELVYFNLPSDGDKAGISDSFPNEMVAEASDIAAGIIREICSGEGCREAGSTLRDEDPAFAALCGTNGLDFGAGEEDE